MSTADDRASLEHALRDDPTNAKLHYLLGAELAQSREYDGAVSELARAIELDPQLHTARFQLGLLHLTMANTAESLAVLRPLESQPDESLRCFARGLAALMHDKFALCLEQLDAGVRLNQSNAPLNRDMQMLAAKVREHVAQQAAGQQTGQPSAQQTGKSAAVPARDAVRTDFSLYDQSRR
jgi:tetratricopeptide (TPR) repeat protein